MCQIFVHFMVINMYLHTHTHTHIATANCRERKLRHSLLVSVTLFNHPSSVTRRWHLVLRFNFNIATRWLIERRTSWNVANIDHKQGQQETERVRETEQEGESRSADQSINSAFKYLIMHNYSFRFTQICHQSAFKLNSLNNLSADKLVNLFHKEHLLIAIPCTMIYTRNWIKSIRFFQIRFKTNIAKLMW